MELIWFYVLVKILKKERHFLGSKILASGTTVAAYYYAENTWNRAVVLAIVPPSEAKHSNFLHQERATVLFLDYGNAENVPLNYIRKLTKCFTHFNAQVRMSINRSINQICENLSRGSKTKITTLAYTSIHPCRRLPTALCQALDLTATTGGDSTSTLTNT